MRDVTLGTRRHDASALSTSCEKGSLDGHEGREELELELVIRRLPIRSDVNYKP